MTYVLFAHIYFKMSWIDYDYEASIFKASFKRIKNEISIWWWNEKMWSRLYEKGKNQEN